jgi:DNA polymerase I
LKKIILPSSSRSAWYVTKQSDADAALSNILNSISSDNEQIYCDTETCTRPEWRHEWGNENIIYKPGLDPYKSRVRLLQIGFRDNVYIIDLFHVTDLTKARTLLEREDVWSWWVNGKFDYKQLAVNADIIVSNLADFMAAARLLNLPASKLAYLVKRYLHRDRDKAEQKSDWSIAELTDEQLTYAAEDVSDMMDLQPVIVTELKEQHLWTAFSIETQALPGTGEFEINGTRIDKARHEANIDLMNQRAHDLGRSLISDLAQYDAQMSLPGMDASINIKSPTQLLALLKKAGLDIEATNKTELKMKALDSPLASGVLDYRKAEKMISSFGDELLNFIHPVTHRIHAEFGSLWAKTFRYTCSHPNLQQIPRCGCKKGQPHTCARAWFTPDDGYQYVMADYAAIEMLGGGVASKDEKLLEIFRRKLILQNARRRGEKVDQRDERLADPHYVTASIITGKDVSEITKGERQDAKPANFGFLYGQREKGFRVYAFVNYGVLFTLQRTTEIREAFFSEAGYPGLAVWHEATQRRYEHVPSVRTLAGYQIPLEYNPTFRSYAGPAALNYQVQNPCAAGNKKAITMLHKAVRPYMRRNMRWKGPMMCRTIHDENHLETPASRAQEDGLLLETCMKEGMDRILRRDDLVSVEAVAGNSWADKA